MARTAFSCLRSHTEGGGGGRHAAVYSPGVSNLLCSAPRQGDTGMQDTPTSVIDPVCGMIVDVAAAEAARLTHEHLGRTYAFCRAGCLRAFREEPHAYVARAEAAAAASPGALGVGAL